MMSVPTESRFAEPNWRGPFVHYGGPAAPQELTSDFVVVDVETTGFTPHKGDRMLEVSAIRINRNGEVLDEFTSLVNPDVEDTGAEHVHGIAPQMLKDAPTFAEVFPSLQAIFSGAIFVAHHAKFDESFLGNEAQLAGKTFDLMPGMCTYVVARDVVRETPNHKLATLSQHFGIQQSHEHYAYHDALSVVSLIPRLLERVPRFGHYVSPSAHVPAPTQAVALTR